jgi:hypothetical protein
MHILVLSRTSNAIATSIIDCARGLSGDDDNNNNDEDDACYLSSHPAFWMTAEGSNRRLGWIGS